MPEQLGNKRMTHIVLRGSVIVAIALTSLLAVHGVLSNNLHIERIIFGLFIVFYLLAGEYFIKRQQSIITGWMIMTLFILLSTGMLLAWGINAPVGVLSIGFTVFLSGVMLGPRFIGWVIAIVAILLCLIQYLHQIDVFRPDLHILAIPSDIFDVAAYLTILGFFALLSWLSGKQTERSLQRAKQAEEKLTTEKNNLAIKLDEESRLLNETKLQEMVSFYNFVEIGRATTVTLHELSNLLSVLSLDIDDIGQRYQRSKAIINAKAGIEQINHLVHQTRRQLDDNRNPEVFNVIRVLNHNFKEQQGKYASKGVELVKRISQRTSFKVLGDTLIFSHVLTILLNNALDACTRRSDGKVIVSVDQNDTTIKIAFKDNGDGIPKTEQKMLFRPRQSTKPGGLGIGLYVTKHIIESQFKGKIYLEPSENGATFIIELPRYQK